MSSTYHTTEGIVLRKTPYGEADYLMRVLTRDFGKIDLRARGARKHNSKLNSHLDFLDEVNISFVKNRDNFPIVIDSQKVFSTNHWFATEESFQEVVKVAHSLDLLIPLEVKDLELFTMSSHFFGGPYEKKGESFVRRIIFYEGYGEGSSLPLSVQNLIINTWPILTN